MTSSLSWLWMVTRITRTPVVRPGSGEEIAVAVRPAIGPIVVDRMIVARGELKSGEERVGHGARGNVKALADPEVVEIAGLGETMRFGRERLIGHRWPPSLDLLDLYHKIAVGELPDGQPHTIPAPEARAVQQVFRLRVEGHPAHLVHESRRGIVVDEHQRIAPACLEDPGDTVKSLARIDLAPRAPDAGGEAQGQQGEEQRNRPAGRCRHGAPCRTTPTGRAARDTVACPFGSRSNSALGDDTVPRATTRHAPPEPQEAGDTLTGRGPTSSGRRDRIRGRRDPGFCLRRGPRSAPTESCSPPGKRRAPGDR